MTVIHPAPAKLNPSLTLNPLMNPNLSASLSLEYGAIVQDVRRAHDLFAEYRRQLVGSPPELEDFAQLMQKTQGDLSQLHKTIVEMREERHRLANEAMRAAALRRKVTEISAERDRLLAQCGTAGTGGTAGELEAVLSEMWRAVERLQTILDPNETREPKPEAGI